MSCNRLLHNPRCSISNHPFHSETYFARGVEVTDAGGGGEGCTPLFGQDRYVALSKVWFLGNCGVFNRGCFCMEACINSVKATDERSFVAPTFFLKKLGPLN